MSDTIQFRRGTNAQRLLATLAMAEPGVNTDTNELTMGDGVTGGGNLVVLTTGDTQAPAAAATYNLAMPANRRHHYLYFAPAAGLGAYEYKVVLPVTGRRDGDKVEVLVEMPANANPTVTFRAPTVGDAPKAIIAGDAGAQRNYRLDFRFISGAWKLWDFRQV